MLDLRQVQIDEVIPNHDQPRKFFDQKTIEELAQSIGSHGILQPLIVVFEEKIQKYRLIAGERRLRAAKLAGLLEVPVLVKRCDLEEATKIALIENIQRSDLNVIEEAHAIRSLIKEFHVTQEDCAKTLGKDRSTITNILRMLILPKEVQEDLISGRLSHSHGKILVGLENRDLILKARDLIVKRELSIKKTEELCKSLKEHIVSGGESSVDSIDEEDANLAYVTDSLRIHLRTKVRLQGSLQRGRMEISFFSGDELSRILDLMGMQL
ncbi:MAG: ParB/RepB/Spo0J family partition protein [Oligoflexales bacterium]|nr:ParB/RepB/Spo0J family partition protein [Oligoflexales bacterium]